MVAGGDEGGITAIVEEYNGSTWATGTSINTARRYLPQSGGTTTSAAALAVCGYTTANSSLSEEFSYAATTQAVTVS